MDNDFLKSKDFEIKELKSLMPGSKEYKRNFRKLKGHMLLNIFKDFKQCSSGGQIYIYKRKRIINIFICVFFILTAFILLGLSILSLGDKEPKDFTSTEMQEFILWMTSVFVSFCASLFFAFRANRYIDKYLEFLIDNYT